MSTRLRPIRPMLTIVTPVFNEQEVFDQYAENVVRMLVDRDELEVRVLLVDDGSTDDSWKLIQRLCSQDHRFRGIRLSRNFGAHTAISAGLVNVDAGTDIACVLACDLQDPPEAVLEFVDQWRAGADIVWGVRRSRSDARWRVAASQLLETALRRWAMPSGSSFTTGSFLLVDRRVLDAVNQMRERNRITFALVAWTGFDQARVEYTRHARRAGRSGWTFRQMVKTMYDAFLGFSMVPIRLMTIAAAGAIVLAVGLIAYGLVTLLVGNPIPGWTSQIFVVSVFFAIQFSVGTIMGQYLYRIYAESVGRPLFFISEDTTEKLG